ncbi:MAG TPA: SufD family Fe-S cluster assembly protein [Clostridiales bacterium]|nr:SufD family Fe-S cluster assembly protein [Clostridiales bacterium]
MILELKEANQLPVKTFRWLGVNELKLIKEIPEIKPFPPVELTGKGVRDAVIGLKHNPSGIELPQTGMGEETSAFLHRYRNREWAITVPKGKKIAEPLFLSYRLDQENPVLAEELLIQAEQDSELTLVITYEGEAGLPLFHGGLIYLLAGKNAVINLIQIQLLPGEGIHLNNIGGACREGASIKITQCELGGGHAVSGIMTALRGENSEMTVDTIYLGDGERFLDLNYVANHYGKNTKSNMRVNGALFDNSRKIFRGTIDFKKGASGSEGAEGEYTLLFDKNIKNISVPLILCGEENVSGKHAANSGRIDENQLFYLMSRGLSEGEAKKLILEAWFHPVLDTIPSETLREQVFGYVKERLNHVKSI